MNPVKNSRLLPIIIRPRSGPIVMTAPDFPSRCPRRSKARTGIIGGSLDDRGCNFACGGYYRVSTSQEKGGSRRWEGICGDKQLCV